jgi:hypothetical protein
MWKQPPSARAETFEALAEGIEKALWQIGGVPQQHRTDHLSAAVRHLRQPEKEEWTVRSQALMAHYPTNCATRLLKS